MALAAGRGERMRPLTHRLAKPALPVLNRPLLSFALRLLGRAGVTRAAVNVHRLPKTIEAVLPECTPEGMEVELFHEENLLGTAGGIRNAESVLRNGPFFLTNSDYLLDVEPEEVLETHRSRGAAATMVLLPFQERAGYAPVEVVDGRVVRIAGRPDNGPSDGTRHIFAGLHVIESSVLDGIPVGEPYEINREVYPALLAAGETIAAHIIDAGWMEFASPSEYLRRTLHLMSPSFRPLLDRNGIEVREEPGGPQVIGAGVTIPSTANLRDGVVLGDGVSVGRDVSVRRTLVWSDAVLGYGCDISDSIIGAGVSLPPESHFHHRIVLARGDDLPPDAGGKREGDLIHFRL